MTYKGDLRSEINKIFLNIDIQIDRKELTEPMISNWKTTTLISKVYDLYKNTSGLKQHVFDQRLMYNITSPWIWKGVSATFQSGRYTLSCPRGRYLVICISWKSNDPWTPFCKIRKWFFLYKRSTHWLCSIYYVFIEIQSAELTHEVWVSSKAMWPKRIDCQVVWTNTTTIRCSSL